MKSRQMLLVLAVAVVIAAGAIFYFTRPQTQLPQAATAVAPAADTTAQSSDLMQPGPLGDMTLGDPKAPNTVIEYASMTCTHCQRFNAEVFKPFKAKYIDTGKVYYIFRDFPLDPVATSAILLAHCAPPDRFFALVDLLFQKQKDWAFVDDPKTALFNLMKQAGFTQESFDACLTNQKMLDGVNSVRDRAASKLGVAATPTFFINGKKKEGEQTLEDLDKLLAG